MVAPMVVVTMGSELGKVVVMSFALAERAAKGDLPEATWRSPQ